MGRPRIMLDVGFFERKKVAELAWRRQLGFIYILTRAKLQDREGVFASKAVLKVAAGVFRADVDDLMAAGLIHDSAALCDKCVKAFPDLEKGSVVIHDWHEYQVSRTTSWRMDRDADETSVKQSGNIGETVVQPLSRAPVARFTVPSSKDVTTEGVQGEPWPAIDAEAITFLEGMTHRHIRQAGDKQLAEYDRHITDHGLPAVMAAYRKVAKLLGPKPTAAQLVWSGRKVLEPFADPKAVAAEDRNEDNTKAARRRDEAVWKRRMELYQSTGKWDPAWGEAPAA